MNRRDFVRLLTGGLAAGAVAPVAAAGAELAPMLMAGGPLIGSPLSMYYGEQVLSTAGFGIARGEIVGAVPASLVEVRKIDELVREEFEHGDWVTVEQECDPAAPSGTRHKEKEKIPMTDRVRAKMRCFTVDHLRDGRPESTYAEVRLQAVYDDGDPTNKSWSQATPSGEVRMMITNPSAVAAFEPGKEYYVDFTPV
jgi:hypothetical protein